MWLQSMLITVDTLARVMTFAVLMRRASWLQNSGIAPDVQQAINGLPFDAWMLFSDKTLQSFKDSRAALCFLGVYTLTEQRRHYGGQQQKQYHLQHMRQPFPPLRQWGYPEKA